MFLDCIINVFWFLAEYSAEPLEKFAEYLVSAESHFGRFGRGSVSAEFHFDRFGKDPVRPNLILAGLVHHYAW